MRIYHDCKEMHSEVRRDLHEMGTHVHPQTMQDMDVADNPDYRTLELSPYSFSILDGSDRHQWIKDIKYSHEWCLADFDERTAGHPINPGNAWKFRADTWRPFIHDGKFAYTYSERLNVNIGDEASGDITALEMITKELERHPDSRQCVLPVFENWTDLPNLGGTKRVPCSMYYQFMRRAEGLRMIYTMRSSDFATHFPYDIWQGLQLQKYVADMLDIPVGRFTFFTGSLHLYAKDADPGVF